MSPTEINYLLEKYKAGQCSEQEQALLNSWYLHQLERPVNLSLQEIEAAEAQNRTDIFNHIKLAGQARSRRLWMTGIAASLLFAVLAFGIVFLQKDREQIKSNQTAYVNDIAPGKNQAVLQLSGGKTIQLNQNKGSVVFDAIGAAYNDGTELDAASEEGKASTVITAITPNGGTYSFVLSDGTKVWLNAASSIRFPQHFDNKTARRVELTGEAFFEVASIKTASADGLPTKVPFIVATDDQEIEVLGTQFNVNSYKNEIQTKTTLLEGSVKLTGIDQQRSLNNGVLLKPGYTAVLKGNKFVISEADIEEALAWKNGYFLFRNESLHSIMRKISRWYDVEVVYEGDFENREFEGSMSRFKNVSEILRKFELTGNIHFKIEGRRIVVMP